MDRPHKRSSQVFISYSQKDWAFAQRLARRLDRDGVDVWFDDWEIRVGESLIRRIDEGLVSSDLVVVLLSPNSVKSRWVDQELNAATIRGIEDGRVSVLPAIIEPCRIPTFLADRKCADFTRDPATAYDELVAAISHHAGADIETRSGASNLLTIAHLSQSSLRRFPVVKFTVVNRSGANQVVNRLECNVVECLIPAGVVESRVLKPLAVWDVELPSAEGVFYFDPPDPVLVADGDAARIGVRFYCTRGSGRIPPRKAGSYRLGVRFHTDQGLQATSELFRL